MPQAATIESLPRGSRMMKAMQAQGIEWGEDYRQAGAQALKDVLEGRMAAGVDRLRSSGHSHIHAGILITRESHIIENSGILCH